MWWGTPTQSARCGRDHPHRVLGVSDNTHIECYMRQRTSTERVGYVRERQYRVLYMSENAHTEVLDELENAQPIRCGREYQRRVSDLSENAHIEC